MATRQVIVQFTVCGGDAQPFEILDDGITVIATGV